MAFDPSRESLIQSSAPVCRPTSSSRASRTLAMALARPSPLVPCSVVARPRTRRDRDPQRGASHVRVPSDPMVRPQLAWVYDPFVMAVMPSLVIEPFRQGLLAFLDAHGYKPTANAKFDDLLIQFLSIKKRLVKRAPRRVERAKAFSWTAHEAAVSSTRKRTRGRRGHDASPQP